MKTHRILSEVCHRRNWFARRTGVPVYGPAHSSFLVAICHNVPVILDNV